MAKRRRDLETAASGRARSVGVGAAPAHAVDEEVDTENASRRATSSGPGSTARIGHTNIPCAYRTNPVGFTLRRCTPR
jgi:hypothetical protein